MPTSLPPQPAPSGKRPSSEEVLRRLLSRAEALTLVGMLLVVFSVFLVWQVIVPPIAPSAEFTAAFVHKGVTVLRGPQWWILWGAAMLCPLLLLWIPTPQTRLPLAIAQGVC